MHSGSWVVTLNLEMPCVFEVAVLLKGAPQTSSGHRLTPQHNDDVVNSLQPPSRFQSNLEFMKFKKWQSNPQFRSLTTNIPTNDVVPVCNTVTSTWNAFVHSFKLNQSFGYFSSHHAIKIWWSNASFDLRSCHHHHQPVSVWLRSKRPCIDPGKLPHSSILHFIVSPLRQHKHLDIFDHMGLSENVVYPYTQWFCWSLSLLNGYFIGGIPHFQTYPYLDACQAATPR